MEKENGKVSEKTLRKKSFSVLFRSISPKQRHHITFALLFICLVIGAILFYYGMQRLKTAYDVTAQNVYNNMYQTAFDTAETQNHVSNYAVITIEDTQEVSRLEVLTVNDSEFVISNTDENQNSGIILWLEVKGTGVFTVDLSASEFIVDSERGYVLVKIPKPVLTECKVSDTGKIFRKNTHFFSNGSVAEGVHLAQSQLSEGRMKLEDSMRQSRRYNEASRKAAKNMIKSLVQQWNPEIPDLQVEVEFLENS